MDHNTFKPPTWTGLLQTGPGSRCHLRNSGFTLQNTYFFGMATSGGTRDWGLPEICLNGRVQVQWSGGLLAVWFPLLSARLDVFPARGIGVLTRSYYIFVHFVLVFVDVFHLVLCS